MNCINCGAFLTDTDLDYCPHCGANVLIQKKWIIFPSFIIIRAGKSQHPGSVWGDQLSEAKSCL